MKTLDRYIISSIMKTSLIATLVFSFILSGVEIFQRMDSIITGGVEFLPVFFYSLLSIPQYFLMVFSISLLFASTYFQSSLSANNERIALLNAGISKWHIIKPIFFLALFLTLFSFILNETALKELESVRVRVSEELFGTTSTSDSRNIVLKSDNGYVVYTRRFIDRENRIVSPIIVEEKDGVIIKRIKADDAVYSSYWTLNNALIYEMNGSGEFVLERESTLSLEDLTLSPEFFKANNINIETMTIKSAFEYLSRLRTSDKDAWQEKATDYLRSLFEPLSVFLLLCISASFDYNVKKNVLLFSIIESLSVAVVYYVSDMVFSIFSHQGAFHPVLSVILPVLSTIVMAVGINEFGKRV